jgi:NAD(P) transhydrogenase subunit alpha
MIVTALLEPGDETRVAITPAAVAHYLKMGFHVTAEHGLGLRAGFSDKTYQAAHADLLNDRALLLAKTNILVLVNEPSPQQLSDLKPQTLIICPVESDASQQLIDYCCQKNLSLFSMNHIPRISRAQTMDSLSSQANLAGYRAVIEALAHYKRAVPMMMTAAGTVHPAQVLVLGAGVAGLQAIATAKRLGAVVYAFDVRAAAKEQVESLGAEFIEVAQDKQHETAGGYAKEMDADYQRLQAEQIEHYATLADIIICTALIPNKKAPILLSKAQVKNMKPGSIIVDLATARGGNCELSERDKVVEKAGLTFIGYSNMAGRIPSTASELYAMNLVNLLRSIEKKNDALQFNPDDQIIQHALLCHAGKTFPFQEKTA